MSRELLAELPGGKDEFWDDIGCTDGLIIDHWHPVHGVGEAPWVYRCMACDLIRREYPDRLNHWHDSDTEAALEFSRVTGVEVIVDENENDGLVAYTPYTLFTYDEDELIEIRKAWDKKMKYQDSSIDESTEQPPL